MTVSSKLFGFLFFVVSIILRLGFLCGISLVMIVYKVSSKWFGFLSFVVSIMMSWFQWLTGIGSQVNPRLIPKLLLIPIKHYVNSGQHDQALREEILKLLLALEQGQVSTNRPNITYLRRTFLPELWCITDVYNDLISTTDEVSELLVDKLSIEQEIIAKIHIMTIEREQDAKMIVGEILSVFSESELPLGEFTNETNDSSHLSPIPFALKAMNHLFKNTRDSVLHNKPLEITDIIIFIMIVSNSMVVDERFSPEKILAVASGVHMNRNDAQRYLPLCSDFKDAHRAVTSESLLNRLSEMFEVEWLSKYLKKMNDGVNSGERHPMATLHFVWLMSTQAEVVLKLYQKFNANLLTDPTPNGLTFIQSFIHCVSSEDQYWHLSEDERALKLFCKESRAKALREKVSFLVREGADLGSGEWGEPPLIFVATFVDADINCVDVCVLDEGASVAEKGWFGRTVLHVASNEQSIRELITEYNADVNAVDFFGRTPLMYAVLSIDCRCRYPSKLAKVITDANHLQEKLCLCVADSVKRLKALIDRGADLNIRDKDGVSVVHLASAGHPEALEILLRHCSLGNVSHMRDKGSATPLHYAVFGNQIECVKILLRFGVDVDIRDQSGRVPSDYADIFRLHDISRLLIRRCSFDESVTGNCLGAKLIELANSNTNIGCVEYRMLTVIKSMTEEECDFLLQSPSLGREYEEVITEVDTLIEKLGEKIRTCDPQFSFTKKLRGSLLERTKVGFPDEFDFNLIMRNIRDPEEIQLSSNVDYPDINISMHPHRSHAFNYQARSRFHRAFTVCILKALNFSDLWEGSRLKMGGLRRARYGPLLSLYWNGTLYKHVKISVDLIPSFEMEDEPFICCKFKAPVDFSGCKLYYVVDGIGESNVSYSEIEAVLMNMLPQSAIEGYKLAKAIRSLNVSKVVMHYYKTVSSFSEENKAIIIPEDFFPSFCLKNLLLDAFNDVVVEGIDVLSITRREWAGRIYMKYLHRALMMVNHKELTYSVCGDEWLRLSYLIVDYTSTG